MISTTTQWRLDVIAHTPRLTDTALRQLDDMNEAMFMVHGVVARAMHLIEAPVTGAALDHDLSCALHRRLAPTE
jgi:hypothetical protein